MKKLSDQDSWEKLRSEVAGFGDHSIKKNYYIELKTKVQELERYRALFDQSGDAILLFSMPEATLADINKAGCKLFNMDYNTIINKGCHNLFPEPIVEILQTRINDNNNLHFFPHIETPMVINGKDYHVELRCSRLDFSNTNYTVLVIHDITSEYAERNINEQLREQLTRAQKMEAIGNLAGGVAHDFNNLILAMSGHAEMAKISQGDPEKYNEHLDEVLNAAEKASRLTKQLLTLGRRQSRTKEIISVNRIIMDISKMLARLLGNDRHLITDLDDNLWPLEIDPGHLEQVILNLVVNAKDAIEESGSITITTNNQFIEKNNLPEAFSEGGHFVQITVADDGCGMDQGTIEKIFEPFFTTKDFGKGTGLGLSTVYSLVRQNNGIIQVKSKKDVGTTFDIFFRKSNQTIPEVKDDTHLLEIDQTKNILIVEDEAMVRKLIYESLMAQNFNVIQASDGKDGLAKFRENSDIIDLIITDIRMPNMNGTQLYDKVRALGYDGEFIFISGYLGSDVERVTQIGDGAQFVQKPFRTSELVKTVKTTLSKKRR